MIDLKTETSIRERLIKGIGAQGLMQAVQIFIRLAEVPLLLSFWGIQLYGEWLILSAIPAYLSIIDGGFVGVTCREMTMQSANGNRSQTLVLYQTTWVFLLVVSLVAGLLAFGVLQCVPLHIWLNFSMMTQDEMNATFMILVIHVLSGFQGSLLNSGFWVVGRYANSMIFIAMTLSLEFFGLAICVIMGGGPLYAAGGLLCGRLIGTLLMFMSQQRICPWLRPGLVTASFAELKRLSKPAFASLALPLGNALNIHGTRMVVGLVLGPTAVALFVSLRTLSRLVMQPANIINRLMEPEMALAYGAGDSALFKRLFTKSCQFALWGCIAACLLFGPGAHWIFPIWTNGKLTLHWPTFLLLLGTVLINSIWYTALMVPYATNRHFKIAWTYVLVYGAAVLGLCFVGASGGGLASASMGLLLGEIAMAVIVLNVSWRMSGVNMSHWAETVLYPPLTFSVKLH